MKYLSSLLGNQMLRMWAGRIFRFGVVGVIAVLVCFVYIYVMVEFAAVPVMVATTIAYLLVMVQNYFMHHYWTFQSDENHRQAFPKFFASSVAGFLINWVIMYVGVEVMNYYYLAVQAFSLLAISVWNLVAGVLWIFGRGKNASNYGI